MNWQCIYELSLYTVGNTLDILLQLRVRAYDTAYPSETATATVNIAVSRNENAPIFGQNPYRVTINETVGVGTCILDVDAVDADGASLISPPQIKTESALD